jgi:hypothetical protein
MRLFIYSKSHSLHLHLHGWAHAPYILLSFKTSYFMPQPFPHSCTPPCMYAPKFSFLNHSKLFTTPLLPPMQTFCLYAPKVPFANHSKFFTTPLFPTNACFLICMCPPPPMHTLPYAPPPLSFCTSSCSYAPKFPFPNHSKFLTTPLLPTYARPLVRMYPSFSFQIIQSSSPLPSPLLHPPGTCIHPSLTCACSYWIYVHPSWIRTHHF